MLLLEGIPRVFLASRTAPRVLQQLKYVRTSNKSLLKARGLATENNFYLWFIYELSVHKRWCICNGIPVSPGPRVVWCPRGYRQCRLCREAVRIGKPMECSRRR